MKTYDVFLKFRLFEKPGLIAFLDGESASDIYISYKVKPDDFVVACWVMETGGSTPILGAAPDGWSRDDQVYQNS